jgi:predicted hydrocarbon binding protein
MSDSNITIKLMNYMFMSMSNTMSQVPFSGRYWMEQLVMGSVQYFIDEYWDDSKLESKKPVEICRTFLNVMDNAGFISANDYQLEESGAGLLMSVQTNKCVYRECCERIREEGFSFNNCIRLGTFQAILRHVLGEKKYSPAVDMATDGFCYGKLTPSTQPKEEIVTREGHKIKMTGQRAFLLRQKTYASLMASIREHAPQILKHVLYDAGYQSGLSLAGKARESYSNPKECLQLILEELTNLGVGKLELVSFNLPSARVKIRCYDSFWVDTANEYGHLYRTPQVICDLLRGVLTGCLSVIFEKEIICEEMTCQSMGADYCEFLALPLPQNLSGGRKP